MRSARVSRRRLLAGLGGAAIALPLLEIGGASAGPLPRRLVIVFTGNGSVEDGWAASGSGSDLALGPSLAALEPHRADLLFPRGVDLESSYHGPGDASHWSGMGHLLTGTSLVDQGGGQLTAGGMSVDQRVALHVGGATKLRSLELCVEEHPSLIATRMSYLGPGQPVPPDPDPRHAFGRLFGEVPAETRARRKSVLDAVSADLAALEARLGQGDRVRVGAHLEAVREIERSLDLASSCGATYPGLRLDPSGADPFGAIGRAQMDILVRALACDLTRVATLQWSTSSSMTRMTWLGIDETHHELSHQIAVDAAARDKVLAIDAWYAEQMAYLLAAMKAVPEGDGSLLDHSVVLWCSEIADGPTHARRGVPLLLAGRCGGYFGTGRAVELGGRPHNDLLITLCLAMGLEVPTFGDPAYCTGPIAELR